MTYKVLFYNENNSWNGAVKVFPAFDTLAKKPTSETGATSVGYATGGRRGEEGERCQWVHVGRAAVSSAAAASGGRFEDLSRASCGVRATNHLPNRPPRLALDCPRTGARDPELTRCFSAQTCFAPMQRPTTRRRCRGGSGLIRENNQQKMFYGV